MKQRATAFDCAALWWQDPCLQPPTLGAFNLSLSVCPSVCHTHSLHPSHSFTHAQSTSADCYRVLLEAEESEGEEGEKQWQCREKAEGQVRLGEM